MLCTNCGLKLAVKKGHKVQRGMYQDYSAEMRRRGALGLKKRYEKLKSAGLAKDNLSTP